ncbi:hypothetical protein ACFLXE_07030 [Chloroflexota bacterium]
MMIRRSGHIMFGDAPEGHGQSAKYEGYQMISNKRGEGDEI